MKIKILSYLWILVWVFVPGFVLAEPILTSIQVTKNKNGERLEFFMTEPAAYQFFMPRNSNRLVIDFKNTTLAANLREVAFNDSVIKTVRGGYPDAMRLRLVFNLGHRVKFKMFSQNQKIVLIIPSALPAKASIQQDQITEQKKTLMPVFTDTTKKKPFIVVIDPGHGGKDQGAAGEEGTKEKNVVLGISHRLAKLINQHSNMRAELTRDGDYFVPLRGRLKLAHKGKADLFIAIHADSYFNAHASGASVYALSRRGATSEAARWLARRDNYSELGGVDLGDLGDKSYVLRSVLIDLAQTATITDSLRLGKTILSSLKNVTKLHYSRVEQAPFVVLKSPDIPSVLVEVGFLSNPKEEKKLRDGAYQDRVAEALFDGIYTYLKKYSAMKV